MEAAIRSACLPVVAVKGALLGANDDDLVRYSDASISLIAPFVDELGLLQAKVALSDLGQHALLLDLSLPGALDGLRRPLLDHEAVVDELLLSEAYEAVLALVDQPDHVVIVSRIALACWLTVLFVPVSKGRQQS